MTDQIKEFLKESNAIEGVYDEDSLNQAMIAWDYLIAEKEVSTHAILRAHKILMLHQPLQPNERGYFRTIPVYIGGREAMRWDLIQKSMKNWVMNANDLIRNGQYEYPPFLEKSIKDHHVIFEHYHPFVDGNGRVGRMLLNYERLKLGLPVLVIKASERIYYYDWFKDK